MIDNKVEKKRIFFIYFIVFITIYILYCNIKNHFAYELCHLPSAYISVSRNGEEQKKSLVRNPYFYQNQEKVVEYEGYFYLHTYRVIRQNINLNITKLGTFEHGTLYTLELDELDTTDPYEMLTSERKYIGYYYVTEDAIYMRGASGFEKKIIEK